MFRIIGLAIALVCFAASPSAAAGPDAWWDDIQREGFSVGLGGNVGAMVSVKDFETSVTTVESGTAGGLVLRGGYRLPKWLGADLHFEWMNSDVDQRGVDPSIDIEADWITFTGDIKLILPRWANSEFFLTVGPGLMSMDGTTDYATRFGGGIDVYFTRSVGITLGAAYVMPIGALKKLDYAVGEAVLFYRF